MFNNYIINKTRNVKNKCYSFTNGVVINRHNIINTGDNYSLTKIHKLVNFSDNSYFTQEIEHKTNITNNITRHNHNNYEHNAIKRYISI